MATTSPELQFEKLWPDDSIITFESFDLPTSNQRILGPPHPKNTVIPLALRPVKADYKATLDTVLETIKNLQAKDGILTKKLARHGTLLFRDLPIQNADDFSKFAHAFGYNPHEIIGIVVDRPLLASNVAPANEAPKEVPIYSHNESPQVPHAPEYIFFYGHRAPLRGGESPISSSLELFNRAQQEIPEFIAEAFGKEIQEGDDEETKRRKIEAQIARYGRGEHTTWEWTDDGLVLSHRLPVVRTQPGTNLPTLFTGLAAYWKRAQFDVEVRKKVTQQLSLEMGRLFLKIILNNWQRLQKRFGFCTIGKRVMCWFTITSLLNMAENRGKASNPIGLF
ncbi:hypothetical protein PDIDSM_4414 [Penicillium digitatum]|nr:hypothetical protein PDIDSM_4414 [Penicillium digitatum]